MSQRGCAAPVPHSHIAIVSPFDGCSAYKPKFAICRLHHRYCSAISAGGPHFLPKSLNHFFGRATVSAKLMSRTPEDIQDELLVLSDHAIVGIVDQVTREGWADQ